MKKVLEADKSISQSRIFKSREKRPTIDYIMNEAPLEERLYWLKKVSEVANKEQRDNMKRWAKMKKKTI
jgi:hypothetical protein